MESRGRKLNPQFFTTLYDPVYLSVSHSLVLKEITGKIIFYLSIKMHIIQYSLFIYLFFTNATRIQRREFIIGFRDLPMIS